MKKKLRQDILISIFMHGSTISTLTHTLALHVSKLKNQSKKLFFYLRLEEIESHHFD